jgi:threonine aldolase
MPKRLCEDHANARHLAELLAAEPGVELDLASVETNIVIFHLQRAEAGEVVRLAKACGVLASAFGPRSIRLVTHRDVDREDCDSAGRVLTECIRQAGQAKS